MEQGLYKCMKKDNAGYVFCVVPKGMNILVDIKTGKVFKPDELVIICPIDFDKYWE